MQYGQLHEQIQVSIFRSAIKIIKAKPVLNTRLVNLLIQMFELSKQFKDFEVRRFGYELITCSAEYMTEIQSVQVLNKLLERQNECAQIAGFVVEAINAVRGNIQQHPELDDAFMARNCLLLRDKPDSSLTHQKFASTKLRSISR